MSTNDPEKLEASIHRLLRSLPDRKAPASLEARVLGELSRRAALPWWRKSYAYWPLAARASFVAASALAAALIVSGLFILLRSPGATAFASGVSQHFSWLVLSRELFAAASDRVRAVAAAIPPLWIYGAAGTIALCYATLAAICAATYRTLTFARQNP
jgi:hypothetical protein